MSVWGLCYNLRNTEVCFTKTSLTWTRVMVMLLTHLCPRSCVLRVPDSSATAERLRSSAAACKSAVWTACTCTWTHTHIQTHRGYCCSASIEAITFSKDVTSVGGLTPKVLHLHAGEVCSDSELSDSGFWDRKTWEIWKINLDPGQWRDKNVLSTVYQSYTENTHTSK